MAQVARWDVWLYWWGWTTDGTAEFAVQPEPVEMPTVDLWATVRGAINYSRGETEYPPLYPVDRRPLQWCAQIVVPELAAE